MTRTKRHGLRLHSLFLWHRYFGLSAALFVLLLAVSGLLLNHTSELKLDRRPVSQDWLLDWYGLPTTAPMRAYGIGPRWVSQIGDQIYFDTMPLAATGELQGAVALDDQVVVALGDGLLLLTMEGELIEKLNPPAPVHRLGKTSGGQLLLDSGDTLYESDPLLLDWRPAMFADAQWIAPLPPPPALRADLQYRYRSSLLSWERFLLDLHSGRLFGVAGVMVVDAAGALLVLLALTGVAHWARRRRA